jgi:nucleotide-binding universal stress UspA family protein
MLVALGEQPWSSAAVSYGIALAAHTGAEVRFLQVPVLPLVTGTPDTSPGSALVVDGLVAHSQATLSWAATAAEEAGVPYTTTMRWGRVVDTILWTADAEDCDLIVVGAPQRPEWQYLLRGSITRRVATSTRWPVLVVPQLRSHPETVIRWSRALVVTDGSPDADITMEYALTLAQAENLDVSLLHVEAAWSPGRTGRSMRRAQEFCTLAAAQAAAAGLRYDVQVATGQAIPTILQAAAHSQCEVIILGVSEGVPWQQLWRSLLTRAVLAEASCPVLLVPSLLGLSATRLIAGAWKFPRKS